jgi:hypothetical protein
MRGREKGYTNNPLISRLDLGCWFRVRLPIFSSPLKSLLNSEDGSQDRSRRLGLPRCPRIARGVVLYRRKINQPATTNSVLNFQVWSIHGMDFHTSVWSWNCCAAVYILSITSSSELQFGWSKMLWKVKNNIYKVSISS